jgi:phosphoenolpyruvate carboxylase
MTTPAPLTPQQLDEIETRAAYLDEYATLTDEPLQSTADLLTGTDVPALVAEIRRLQRQRRYLIDQLAKRDAESGRGDEALREFLSDDDPATPAS